MTGSLPNSVATDEATGTSTHFNRGKCAILFWAYIQEHFPEWEMGTDVVYRFMMAVRKKLG